MFPAAARANPAIFKTANGDAKTVAAVLDSLTSHQNGGSSREFVSANPAFISAAETSAGLGNGGITLSNSMIMTLLELQDMHLENDRESRNDPKYSSNYQDV
jgi:hypothetical protein